MAETKIPRFEFRTFGQQLSEIGERMKLASKPEVTRESTEVYIISEGTDSNIAKIMDNRLDIKARVGTESGLEQWVSRMKEYFPMPLNLFNVEAWPAFNVSSPDIKVEEITFKHFIDEIVVSHPDLVAVKVQKHRTAFTINNCNCEYAQIWVNGAAIQTVHIESNSIEHIQKTRAQLGLQQFENINYQTAIKRIIGMEPVLYEDVQAEKLIEVQV